MMRRRMVVAFLAPALMLYLGFLVLPAIQAFCLSFYQTSGFGNEPVWVGFGNYAKLWHDSIFWRSLGNMALILFVGGVATFGLAFLFTMLLNSGLWGKKLFRALIFLPNIIAVVAITTFWSFVFTPRYGLLSNFFKALGLDRLASVTWTAPENIFYSMMVGLVWISAGFFTILILAGADKVPADMYEAARLEGASNWQIFRLVTLPMIWDVVLITLVLWAIQAIKIVEFPYAFGGPNINQSLYTPAIYLYIMGFGQREPVYALGYATAIGVILFVLTIVTVVFLRLVFRREKVEF
ncbi:sugar ABC transporter permease [Rhizobium sp. TH2]|uniref:carbohydrate ABC transporter permease n=1 Tax=Rhizobium sp. TH2 TaxID=2775403 RepID=UPI0021579E13|nr:sugar ABC transporter permease [Rhizobium sp. TH2]UVC09454.1 sugar ABC transporter permease [Rhizobium sp. TH2]